MTRFYDFVRQDYGDVYADALMCGTYEQLPRCANCQLACRRRIPPLIIEWDDGSNVIGDFTWPAGLEEIVVSDRVKTCFQSNGLVGIEFEPVEMFQKPNLKKPTKESRAKRRVWLPYNGPPLWSLVVTSSFHLDLVKSKRSVVNECQRCGRERMIVHDRAAPLVLTGDLSQRADLFRIREMGKLVFGVESVRQIIEENRFTNVQMKERGRL